MSESDRTGRTGVRGFLSLPSTNIGKWSARLLVVSVVLVLVNTAVVMPTIEQRPGFELLLTVVNAVVGSCVVAAGIFGLIALARRERSWTAVLATLILVVVAVMFVEDLVTPGQ